MDLISGWGLALSGFAVVAALAALGAVVWLAAQSDPWGLPASERFPLGPEGFAAPAPFKVGDSGIEPVLPQVEPDYITRAEAAVMIADAVDAAIRQCRDDLARHRARDDRRMR